jgi:hypothetical protein
MSNNSPFVLHFIKHSTFEERAKVVNNEDLPQDQQIADLFIPTGSKCWLLTHPKFTDMREDHFESTMEKKKVFFIAGRISGFLILLYSHNLKGQTKVQVTPMNKEALRIYWGVYAKKQYIMKELS